MAKTMMILLYGVHRVPQSATEKLLIVLMIFENAHIIRASILSLE